MGMIRIRHKGDFSKTTKFLNHVLRCDYKNILAKYGKLGVEALASSTPIDSGLTSESWRYGIERTKKAVTLYWTNDNVQDGVNIAIILRYGHGTGDGTYIEGRNYIKPALRPIFDQMERDVWKEVIKI